RGHEVRSLRWDEGPDAGDRAADLLNGPEQHAGPCERAPQVRDRQLEIPGLPLEPVEVCRERVRRSHDAAEDIGALALDGTHRPPRPQAGDRETDESGEQDDEEEAERAPDQNGHARILAPGLRRKIRWYTGFRDAGWSS